VVLGRRWGHRGQGTIGWLSLRRSRPAETARGVLLGRVVPRRVRRRSLLHLRCTVRYTSRCTWTGELDTVSRQESRPTRLMPRPWPTSLRATVPRPPGSRRAGRRCSECPSRRGRHSRARPDFPRLLRRARAMSHRW
jgi:hypothetical protein